MHAKTIISSTHALNAMHNAEKRMRDIFDTPELTADQKSYLYSNKLNRFMTYKNKAAVPFYTPVVKV